MIQIRPMCREDIPQVAEIEREIFSQPWSAQGFLDTLHNKNTIYLSAEENGEILGYLGLWKSFPEADITNVAVKEAARRRGVAGLLLREAKRLSTESGLTALTLEVRAGNTAAIRLYEKHGFYSVGVRPGFYALPREDAIIMRAELS